MNTNDLHEAAAALHGMELVKVVHYPSHDVLLKLLEERVNLLINHDLQRLIQILYRMDVPEKELRRTLDRTNGSNAALTIATMMLNRELQIIETRKRYRSMDDIPEEDKW
ncbi:hypothetical protein EXU57_17215 [Segetibacter sp. 3557_3]|uniref:hypothetical protein n=1 Tax=Segetibacter sp. 3557_3 TaxID=2547429 RepID=UPI00105851DE|nr:hypothetical protein [Segetibacter sp. 3557_3]TDH23216.1 hypothetical protein EXU57_17215 [Segetibacter sp. 3557_3]